MTAGAIVRPALCAAALAALPAMATGQSAEAVRRGPQPLPRATASETTQGLPSPGTAAAPGRTRSVWWTPIASAVLPGSGQARLSQDRFIAYLALEGYMWSRYLADRREGRDQRSRYRALARDVARARFSGPKPAGNFDYYERMENFLESGVYDRVPGGDIQPELDVATYNGSLWLLARRTYWEDPEVPPPPESEPYRQAMELYQLRATRPEYRWSWRDAELEQDLFRRTIDRSNDAVRRSILDLSVLLANHALSTVDAFVTLRLRQRATPARAHAYAAEVTVPWAPFGRPSATGTSTAAR